MAPGDVRRSGEAARGAGLDAVRLSGKPAVVGGRGLLRRDAGAGAGRAPPEANGFARSMVSLFLIVFIGGRALLN